MVDVVGVLGVDGLGIAVWRDEEVDLPSHAQARHDLGGALRIDDRFGQQDPLSALLVVEGSLQESGRLAGIHRPVPEVEFGHCHPLSVVRADTEDYPVPGGV